MLHAAWIRFWPRASLFRVLTVDRGKNSWNAKDTNYPVASRHQAKSGCIASGPSRRGRFSRFVRNVYGQWIETCAEALLYYWIMHIYSIIKLYKSVCLCMYDYVCVCAYTYVSYSTRVIHFHAHTHSHTSKHFYTWLFLQLGTWQAIQHLCLWEHLWSSDQICGYL